MAEISAAQLQPWVDITWEEDRAILQPRIDSITTKRIEIISTNRSLYDGILGIEVDLSVEIEDRVSIYGGYEGRYDFDGYERHSGNIGIRYAF